MSSNTKAFEEKMKSAVEHLERELKTVRAGRANPGVLDKVTVDYYGSPTPIQQVASVAVSEARTLTITPWDRTLLRAISKAILASDVGINPIDDGQTRLPPRSAASSWPRKSPRWARRQRSPSATSAVTPWIRPRP